MEIVLKVFSHHFDSFIFYFFSIWLSAFFFVFLLPPRAVNFARCRAKVKVRVKTACNEFSMAHLNEIEGKDQPAQAMSALGIY